MSIQSPIRRRRVLTPISFIPSLLMKRMTWHRSTCKDEANSVRPARRTFSLLVGLLCILTPHTRAWGQPAEEPPPSEEITDTPEPVELKYFTLRYEEDWSRMRSGDFFDQLKDIDLGSDWRLDIGGSLRLRMMSESNKLYGARTPTQDTYLLQQYLLHANLRFKDVFRFYVEGIHAQVDDRQTPAIGTDENLYDIHQAFIDLRLFGSGTPLVLRVGRQELLFGNQRLVSPLPWGNTRRRFDGVDLLWRSENWDLDGFYVRPVPVSRNEALDRKWDEYDADQHFFGVYSTYHGWEDQLLDVYYLVLLDDSPTPNSAGLVRQLTLHTLGFRYGATSGPWDFETEAAMQLGHHSGDEIFAWMWTIEGGYTFDLPASPRLSLGFDWATGDHDPFDNQHNTFNQLFPLGHKYLGWLDQIGRQNILGPHIGLSLKPCKPIVINLQYHHFFLDQNDDGLYNAGGAMVRRDLAGNSGSAVGAELDLSVLWKIDKHQSLLFGYSHLWPGGFVEQTGDQDDPDLIYVQYLFTF